MEDAAAIASRGVNFPAPRHRSVRPLAVSLGITALACTVGAIDMLIHGHKNLGLVFGGTAVVCFVLTTMHTLLRPDAMARRASEHQTTGNTGGHGLVDSIAMPATPAEALMAAFLLTMLVVPTAAVAIWQYATGYIWGSLVVAGVTLICFTVVVTSLGQRRVRKQ